VTLNTLPSGIMHTVVLVSISQQTKLELPYFHHFKDKIGPQHLTMDHVT